MSDKGIDKYLSKAAETGVNITTPASKKVGLALAALTEAGLHKMGIGRVFEYNAKQSHTLNQNLEKLAIELEKKDEAFVIEAPSEIVHPIGERLSYVSDGDLSSLFAKLLAKASSKDEGHLAHPAYINILDQLSPDEAKLLKELMNHNFKVETISFGTRDTRPEKSGATNTHSKYFSKLPDNIVLNYPQNIELYMANLISLGLIEIQEGWFIPKQNKDGKNVKSDNYEELVKRAGELVKPIVDNHKFYSKNGILRATAKGHSFILAVTS